MNLRISTTEERARLSRGTSLCVVYQMVQAALVNRHPGSGVLLDVGCGRGDLWQFVAAQFAEFHGVDIVRYDGFPEEAAFHAIDLDTGQVQLPSEFADVVVAVETIEHLENPRAFMRELVRLTKPNGWVVVTTPNQQSFLSKVTMLIFNEFNAFRAGSYPAHLTALLEVDLLRIANECHLADPSIRFSGSGRVPGLSVHWPRILSRTFPRAFSDNILIVARKR